MLHGYGSYLDGDRNWTTNVKSKFNCRLIQGIWVSSNVPSHASKGYLEKVKTSTTINHPQPVIRKTKPHYDIHPSRHECPYNCHYCLLLSIMICVTNKSYRGYFVFDIVIIDVRCVAYAAAGVGSTFGVSSTGAAGSVFVSMLTFNL